MKLAEIVAYSSLFFSLGCPQRQDPPDRVYVTGTVMKESGTLPGLLRSEGALFGNGSVRLGDPSYVLTVESAEGVRYVFQVVEMGNKPLAALAEAIEPGDLVRFPVMNSWWTFPEDNIGYIRSEDITRIRK